MDNDEFVRAIVEVLASHCDSLDAKIFKLGYGWWRNRRQLATITGAGNSELFRIATIAIAQIIARNEAPCLGCICEIRLMESVVKKSVEFNRIHDMHRER